MERTYFGTNIEFEKLAEMYNCNCKDEDEDIDMDEDKTRTRRYRKGKITYDMSPIPQKLFMRRSHINEEEDNEVE